LPLVVEETAMERRGLCFIDADVGRKARKEARRGGKIARDGRWRANAGNTWRLLEW
jgi:hypothetical protein